jgi:hypothetical protein
VRPARFNWILLVFLAVSFVEDQPAAARVLSGVRTVALTGQPIPGFTSEYQWGNMNLPVINYAGHVAFSSDLQGPNNLTSGIWSEAGGVGLQLVAGQNQQAPGTPVGTTFNGLSARPFQYNEQSEVAFFRGVGGAGTDFSNDGGIWAQRDGVLELVVRETDLAPGAGTAQFGILSPPAFNDSGDVAFFAWLNGVDVNNSSRFGIWTDAGNPRNLRLIARSGNQAPGAPAGMLLGEFQEPLLNSTGDVAFLAPLVGTAVNATNNQGLWLTGQDGTTRLVARKGGQVPSLSTGTSFGDFSTFYVRLNDAGRLMFHSKLQGAGVTDDNRDSLWVDHAGSQLELVARQGDPAPGAGLGVKFAQLFGSSLNESNHLLFGARLSGPEVLPQGGLSYWQKSDELRLIVRFGDQAPGLDPGWNISGISAIAMNDLGDIVYHGSATNGLDYVEGLWFKEFAQAARPIALQGDLIDVDNGTGVDLRSLYVSNFQSDQGAGFPIAFNNRRELVVRATFDFASSGGILVFTVPEPGSMPLILFGWMSLAAFCRSRHPWPSTEINQ